MKETNKTMTFRSTTETMNIRMFSDRSIGGRGFKSYFQSGETYEHTFVLIVLVLLK